MKELDAPKLMLLLDVATCNYFPQPFELRVPLDMQLTEEAIELCRKHGVTIVRNELIPLGEVYVKDPMNIWRK